MVGTQTSLMVYDVEDVGGERFLSTDASKGVCVIMGKTRCNTARPFFFFSDF